MAGGLWRGLDTRTRFLVRWFQTRTLTPFANCLAFGALSILRFL